MSRDFLQVRVYTLNSLLVFTCMITCQELHLRETQLKEELQSKEAEISRLQECLGLLHEAEMVRMAICTIGVGAGRRGAIAPLDV